MVMANLFARGAVHSRRSLSIQKKAKSMNHKIMDETRRPANGLLKVYAPCKEHPNQRSK
jgi:hypothetical protein